MLSALLPLAGTFSLRDNVGGTMQAGRFKYVDALSADAPGAWPRPGLWWRLAVSSSLCLPLLASAAPPDATLFRFDEVVVTGSRFDEAIYTTPRNVTLLTRREIEASPSRTLGELLAREAGVQLRSVNGSDKWSSVDIRGQGDAGASNVLLVVDGMVWNAPDQSGADYGSLPIQDIERIEILRGPGAVRYGSGAVGGVVQILTRNGRGHAQHAEARTRAGSFDSADTGLRAGGDFSGLTLRATAHHADSDGARDHNATVRNDIGLRLARERDTGTREGRAPSAELILGYHDDRYDLPGAVSAANFLTEAGRTRSDGLNAHGETRLRRAQAQITAGTPDRGEWNLQAGYRNRDNPYFPSFVTTQPESGQLWRIREDTAHIENHGQWRWKAQDAGFGTETRVSLGTAWTGTNYEQLRNGLDVVDQTEVKQGRIENAALFIAGRREADSGTVVTAGYRRDRMTLQRGGLAYKQDFTLFPVITNVWLALPDTRAAWTNDAWELGLTTPLGSSALVYLDLATSFRNPNVDDLTKAAPDLRPQTGQHYEAGVRGVVARRAEANLSVFHGRTTNEIFYDNVAALNRNAVVPTLRTGVETDLRWKLTPALNLTLTGTWLDARFVDGAPVPLVPRTTGALGAEWQRGRFDIQASGRHVSARADGNTTLTTVFPELPPYTVFDMRAGFRTRFRAGGPGAVEWHLGVSNLTDEIHATSAYSGSRYPMPGRSYHAGVRVALAH